MAHELALDAQSRVLRGNVPSIVCPAVGVLDQRGRRAL
jgi:hypothetical protein